MFEFYYNFITNTCATGKYEKMGMDTNSVFLALAEEELHDLIRSEIKQEWEFLCRKVCNDLFTAVACSSFLPKRVVLNTKKTHCV